MAGGAYRKPLPTMDSELVHSTVAGYVANDACPFMFDVYNGLTPSQAANGPGLLKCMTFARRWIAAFPHAQVGSKQFSKVLESLVEGGAFARWAAGHPIWDSLNPFDNKQRTFWCSKQAGKAIVILYHLRRLKTTPVKRVQALASLSSSSKAQIQEVLDMIVVPPPPSAGKTKIPPQKKPEASAYLSFAGSQLAKI